MKHFFLVVTYVNIFTQCLYTSFPYFGVFWFSVLFYFQSIASAFIFYVTDNQIRFCFPFSSPVFFCYNISTILIELYNKDTLFSLLPTYFNLRSSIVHQFVLTTCFFAEVPPPSLGQIKLILYCPASSAYIDMLFRIRMCMEGGQGKAVLSNFILF